MNESFLISQNRFGVDISKGANGAYAQTPLSTTDIDNIIWQVIQNGKVGDIWVQEDGYIFYRENNEVLQVSGIDQKELKKDVFPAWLEKLAHNTDIRYATDTAYTLTRGSLSRRFRVNLYRSLGKLRACLRLVADSIATPDSLRVPRYLVQQFSNYNDGLVLVCGATGSGKSTTIASMLATRAAVRREHIITLEDPIEYLFKDSLAFFSQREKGSDFADYPEAVKYALRESPDTIFIGEIRDVETAEAALHAAETGHLVVSTMHTKRATDALERFLLMFPESDKGRILSMMSSVMRFVLCQRLLPSTDGKRKAIFEPMVTDEASNLLPVIRRGERLAVALRNAMEQTKYTHNYSFVKDIRALHIAGEIDSDVAKNALAEFEGE